MRKLFLIFILVLRGAQEKLRALGPREGVWGRKWGEKSAAGELGREMVSEALWTVLSQRPPRGL